MSVVSASLWSVDGERVAQEAARLAAAGVQRFHWDHADGTMGPAGGFEPERARALLPAGRSCEAHLMHRDPRPQVERWVGWCDAVAVHADQPFWAEAMAQVRGAGVQAVLAIGSAAELDQAGVGDGVLVMSVRPGHAGSDFDDRCFDIVGAARDRGHTWIGVDGSLTPERGRRLSALGATLLVSGTSLTAAPDPGAWLTG